jgi:phage host-nuclease inhibitor protein Gam
MRKIKSITTTLPFPKNDDEASAALREAINKNNENVALEAKRQKALAKVNRAFDKQARPLIVEGLTLASFVFTYAEQNRDRLTQSSGAKTVELNDGEAKWRLNPPSLEILDKAKAVKRMLKRKLDDLLEVEHSIKKNPTKEYLDKGGKRIPGLRIIQEEELALLAKSGKYKIKRSELPKLRLKTPPA